MAFRTKRGFTLVELLTVIAVIAVLAALLLPAMSLAKFQAKNTFCRSNLRQTQLAVDLYVTTFDAYPPAWSPVEGQTNNWYRWDLLLAHLAAPARSVIPFSLTNGTRVPARTFLCPLLIGRPENMLNSPWPAWDSAFRYNCAGVARAFSPLGLGGTEISFPLFAATKQSALVSPSELITLGDPLTRSPDADLDNTYDPFAIELRPQPPGAASYNINVRTRTVYRNHRSRYNRSYADGHREIEDCRKPFIDSDAYLALWNIDHEPHRDLWKP